MTWLLVILLYAPEVTEPVRVERRFPTRALCEQERTHLARQAIPAELSGRLVLWCEEQA